MSKIGSLFTGYGGLDDAIVELTGGRVAFVSDIDAGAVKYLDHHHPDVPNIGDMTAVDWSAWHDVDVIVGGYPCQPFSAAGRRQGKNDERHLWPNVLDALTVIRPSAAYFENVRGHLNLGFGDVLTDLTSNGYNVRWSIVAASSVGAPHRRERLYIYAYADDRAERVDLSALPDARQYGKKIPPAGHTVNGELVVEPRADDGVADPAGALLPTPVASDAKGRSATGRPGGASLPDTAEELVGVGVWTPFNTVGWGKYARAVARWSLLTRPAPVPVQKNRNGNPQLTAEFSEWVMGISPGRLTSPDLGLTRTQALKMAGNGVVPHAALYAFTALTSDNRLSVDIDSDRRVN